MESLPSLGGLGPLWSAATADRSPFAAVGFEVSLDDSAGFDCGAVLRSSSVAVPSSPPFDSDIWDVIRRLCARWTRRGSIEQRVLSHVFLEFDTSRGVDQFRSPSVFLGIKPEAQFDGGEGRYRPHPAAGTLRILPSVLEGLLGRPIDTSTNERLVEFVSALPTGSIVLHLGLMLSRSRAIRMHVAVPAHAATAFLGTVGLESLFGDVDRLIVRYGGGGPLATLQFEVGERVAEVMGVEFSAGSALDPSKAPVWAALMRRLTKDELCARGMHDAVLKWPSKRPHRQDLSHVKITVRPGQPLRAKAYLSVVPSFSLFGPR